jgi:hypothetical protein
MDIVLNIMLSVEPLARQPNPLLIRSLDQSYPLVIGKHECIIPHLRPANFGDKVFSYHLIIRPFLSPLSRDALACILGEKKRQPMAAFPHSPVLTLLHGIVVPRQVSLPL